MLAKPQLERMRSNAIDKFNPKILYNFLDFLFKCRAGEKISTNEKTPRTGKVRSVSIYFHSDDSKKAGNEGGLSGLIDKKKAKAEDRAVSIHSQTISDDSGICNDIFLDASNWILNETMDESIPSTLYLKCIYQSSIEAREMAATDTPDSSVQKEEKDPNEISTSKKTPEIKKIDTKKMGSTASTFNDFMDGAKTGSAIGNEINEINKETEALKVQREASQAINKEADTFAPQSKKSGSNDNPPPPPRSPDDNISTIAVLDDPLSPSVVNDPLNAGDESSNPLDESRIELDPALIDNSDQIRAAFLDRNGRPPYNVKGFYDPQNEQILKDVYNMNYAHPKEVAADFIMGAEVERAGQIHGAGSPEQTELQTKHLETFDKMQAAHPGEEIFGLGINPLNPNAMHD